MFLLTLTPSVLNCAPVLTGAPQHAALVPARGCPPSSAQALLLQWAEALSVFQQAADWIGLESRKSLWGQFWSAHQRFFKYLCIAAKVHRLVELAQQELSRDKVSVHTSLWRAVILETDGAQTPHLPIPAVRGHRAAVHRGGADPRGAR